MNDGLRKKFQSGETAYGLWVTLESPAITEVAAKLGLDWICIDLEHGPLDYRNVRNHLLAARGSGLSVLVRPPTHELEPTKRVLDLGADGIILPMVETADQVLAVGENMLYPPQGRRGIGGERNVCWGLEMDEYVSGANDAVMLIPMIETRQAAENIDEILAVPGLEAIFLGPGDMSASYGFVGQWEGPGVAELNLNLKRSAAAKGILTGVVGRNVGDVLERRNQGFGMVSIGSDIGLMVRGLQANITALEKDSVPHRWF